MQCTSEECEAEAVMAIRTTAPHDKALVHTVWQDERDAPKTAIRYCGRHGVHLAANLAALTDAELAPVRVSFYGE